MYMASINRALIGSDSAKPASVSIKIIIIKPAAVHVNEILKTMGGNILQNNCEQ